MSEKTVRCCSCGKEIKTSEAVHRGTPYRLCNEQEKQHLKCSDCDYVDYSNTYGGM